MTILTLAVDKQAWRQETFGPSHARLTGVQSDAYDIVRSIAHAIDQTITESVIREATDQRIARFAKVLTNVPTDTLQALRCRKKAGLKVALISNADVVETGSWAHSPLATCFDETVISWQVGVAKPDPTIYEHCLSLLGLMPAQTIFVGDGGSQELAGAADVGMTPVFAKGRIPQFRQSEIEHRIVCSTFQIDSLLEFVPDQAKEDQSHV